MSSEEKELHTQIPKIPFDKRIIPNDMIRSSLFSVNNHNCVRTYLKNHKVYTYRSTDIIYTGEELRQDDEDVWMQLIYMASESDDNYLEIRPYTFLALIGVPQRTQYRDRLKLSLTRMSATAVELFNHEFKQGLSFSLVRKFEWSIDGSSLKKWKIWLEPEVVKLFSALGKTYTKIDWQQRSKLKPLAKWLHAFYSSHSEPQPVHVKKIMELSGSKMKSLRHFKANLKQSLIELVQIGFIEPDFLIDHEYFLMVTRSQSGYKRVSYV